MIAYYVYPGISNVKCIKKFKPSVLPSKVVDVICDQYHISLADLRGRSRKGLISYPRHLTFYLLSRYCFKTQEETAEYLQRDRTTVLNSIEVIKGFMSSYVDVLREVGDLESKIFSN